MLKERLISARLFVCVLLSVGGWLTGQGQAALTAQQTMGSVTISSPNAAALGKFGDIPVSYHTGVPQIGVPIYTVKAGPLNLPISLDYHASGIKCMEPASWVGTGWALNAGGVITRTVQGQPDEVGPDGSIVQQYGHFSHYGYNSYFYTTVAQNGNIQDWNDFSTGQRDGEPDLFFFNFAGYSGKFYFRDDRTPVLVPQQDLTIIPSYSGGRSMDYFTIVTPDGAKYIFGNSSNVTGTIPIETTNTFSIQHNVAVPAGHTPPTSSWYLNEVVSADGQFTINLSYVPETYGFYTLSLFPVDASNTNAVQSYGIDVVKDLVQGVRLSQISFPNGNVNFTATHLRTDLCDANAVQNETANTSAASLDAIQITDGAGLCKNFNFSYTYFQGDNTTIPAVLTNSTTLTTDETRLRLDQITETSCDGTTAIPPYKFTYNNTGVQRRLSFGIDHWGYFNGVTSNTGLIPTLIVNGTASSPGATRDAAWPNMSAATLTRIDYPTGGYNTFTFESNSGLVAVTSQTNNILATTQLAGPWEHQTNTTYSYSGTCTSNGSIPVTLEVETSCNVGGTIQILNATGGLYFATSFNNTTQAPGGSPGNVDGTIFDREVYNYGTSISPFMPAGNYTIKIALTTIGSQVPQGGVYVQITQAAQNTTYQNVALGGLRIKTITAQDGLTSNPVVTNYSYTNPSGNSTAVLYSVPTYAMLVRNDIVADEGYWAPGTGYTQTTAIANGCPALGDYIKSPGSIRPMATVQGGIVGYQTVTVSQPGNGSSVYTYFTSNSGFPSFTNQIANNSVTPSNCDPNAPNFPPAPLPFDSRRGELQMEQHYNNSGQLVKDVSYLPAFNETPILPTPAFIVQNHSLNGNGMLLATQYSLNTVKKVSMLTMQDDYGANGSYVTTTKTVYYSSAFHNQPTKEQTSTSTAGTISSTFQYAADFRLASCDAISDCSTEYTTGCQSCAASYTNALNQSGCSGSSTCITTAFLAYQQCLTTARTSYVSCRNTNYMTGTNSAFGKCRVPLEAGADANLKPVLQLQDLNMNPVIESTQMRDGLLQHSNYTAFAPATTPANFPYPGQTQLINLQAVSSSFPPAAVSGSTITKDGRYLTESQYVFNAGNVQQVLPYNGVPISYVWDYLHTQPIAKVTNAPANQIAYSSFEADGTGNWVVSSTLRDAGSITGSKCYNVTNGQITFAGLTASSKYIISFWTKGGSIGVAGSVSGVQGKTINGWTYYEYTVTGITSAIVNGNGDIDELRLYPANAQMTTYTYAPMIGMTSQCDVDNRVSFFNYDPLGRLMYVQDQDGNIIKTYQYHYKGQ